MENQILAGKFLILHLIISILLCAYVFIVIGLGEAIAMQFASRF